VKMGRGVDGFKSRNENKDGDIWIRFAKPPTPVDRATRGGRGDGRGEDNNVEVQVVILKKAKSHPYGQGAVRGWKTGGAGNSRSGLPKPKLGSVRRMRVDSITWRQYATGRGRIEGNKNPWVKSRSVEETQKIRSR